MATFRDALLPAIDSLRGLPGILGLRLYTVKVRVVTSSGDRPGQGSKTVVDTPITVKGGYAPKVVQIVDQDVVAGGVYTKTKYEIRGIVPSYPGGGTPTSTLDPAQTTSPTEVFYVITGPGTPPTGHLCKKIADKFDKAFGYTITVETLGKAA